MPNQGEITVEFFGIPRRRAGCAEMHLPAATVAGVLTAVCQRCPQWTDLLRPDGRLAEHYLLSLEGNRFLTDLTEPLQPGSHLLLLSADPGG